MTTRLVHCILRPSSLLGAWHIGGVSRRNQRGGGEGMLRKRWKRQRCRMLGTRCLISARIAGPKKICPFCISRRRWRRKSNDPKGGAIFNTPGPVQLQGLPPNAERPGSSFPFLDIGWQHRLALNTVLTCKKNICMLFLLILGQFWCSLVTSVT